MACEKFGGRVKHAIYCYMAQIQRISDRVRRSYVVLMKLALSLSQEPSEVHLQSFDVQGLKINYYIRSEKLGAILARNDCLVK